jgi:hypothetical protein
MDLVDALTALCRPPCNIPDTHTNTEPDFAIRFTVSEMILFPATTTE